MLSTSIQIPLIPLIKKNLIKLNDIIIDQNLVLGQERI